MTDFGATAAAPAYAKDSIWPGGSKRSQQRWKLCLKVTTIDARRHASQGFDGCAARAARYPIGMGSCRSGFQYATVNADHYGEPRLSRRSNEFRAGGFATRVVVRDYDALRSEPLPLRAPPPRVFGLRAGAATYEQPALAKLNWRWENFAFGVTRLGLSHSYSYSGSVNDSYDEHRRPVTAEE